MRGSTTGRPIMALLDLLGRRWSLRVLWELRDGPTGFRALRVRCDDMSPTVLRERLLELVDAGVVERDERGDYALSASGRELAAALRPLQAWAEAWAARSP